MARWICLALLGFLLWGQVNSTSLARQAARGGAQTASVARSGASVTTSTRTVEELDAACSLFAQSFWSIVEACHNEQTIHVATVPSCVAMVRKTFLCARHASGTERHLWQPYISVWGSPLSFSAESEEAHSFNDSSFANVDGYVGSPLALSFARWQPAFLTQMLERLTPVVPQGVALTGATMMTVADILEAVMNWVPPVVTGPDSPPVVITASSLCLVGADKKFFAECSNMVVPRKRAVALWAGHHQDQKSLEAMIQPPLGFPYPVNPAMVRAEVDSLTRLTIELGRAIYPDFDSLTVPESTNTRHWPALLQKHITLGKLVLFRDHKLASTLQLHVVVKVPGEGAERDSKFRILVQLAEYINSVAWATRFVPTTTDPEHGYLPDPYSCMGHFGKFAEGWTQELSQSAIRMFTQPTPSTAYTHSKREYGPLFHKGSSKRKSRRYSPGWESPQYPSDREPKTRLPALKKIFQTQLAERDYGLKYRQVGLRITYDDPATGLWSPSSVGFEVRSWPKYDMFNLLARVLSTPPELTGSAVTDPPAPVFSVFQAIAQDHRPQYPQNWMPLKYVVSKLQVPETIDSFDLFQWTFEPVFYPWERILPRGSGVTWESWQSFWADLRADVHQCLENAFSPDLSAWRSWSRRLVRHGTNGFPPVLVDPVLEEYGGCRRYTCLLQWSQASGLAVKMEQLHAPLLRHTPWPPVPLALTPARSATPPSPSPPVTLRLSASPTVSMSTGPSLSTDVPMPMVGADLMGGLSPAPSRDSMLH